MDIMDHETTPRSMNYYPLPMRYSVNYDKFTFTWEIKNFNEVMDIFKNRAQVSSPIFPTEKTSGVEWSMLMYPNGENPECADDLSIFLALQLGYPDVTVDFTITLLDASGRTLQSRSIDDAEFKSGHHNVCWGFYDFYSIAKMLEILEDPSMPNSNITILCEIDYKTGRQDSPPKHLSQMAGMLESGRFSDVTIVCQDKIFLAHKIVLVTRSPVFAVMFEHNENESKESYVVITDVEPVIMQELLKFMYYNHVDNFEKHACSLLAVATKYQIEELADKAQKMMYGTLNIKNCVSLLILGDFYKAKKLMSKAISFIVANMGEVVSTQEYCTMKHTHAHLAKEVLKAMAPKGGDMQELKKSKHVKYFTSNEFEYYPIQTKLTKGSLYAIASKKQGNGGGGDDGTLAKPTRTVTWQSPSTALPHY